MNVIRTDKTNSRNRGWPFLQNVRAQTVGMIPRGIRSGVTTGISKCQSNAFFKTPGYITSASVSRSSSTAPNAEERISARLSSLMANTTPHSSTTTDKNPNSILAILNKFANKTPSNKQTSVLPRTSSSSSSFRNAATRWSTSDDQKTLVRTSTSSGSGGQTRNKSSTSRTPMRTPVRTPKSMTTTSSESDATCIVAICEGRGYARGEVGIAALDVRHPHLVLCQISDSQSYVSTLTKVNIFNPVEILVPHTFCENQQTSKLFSSINEMFPTVTLTSVQRRHFNETSGLTQVQHLCATEFATVELLVQHKFYALASAAALLKYVEYMQNMIFAARSLKIEYQGSKDTTQIDVHTSNRLELVRSLRGCGAHHSLIGILNHCHTGCGSRLLRASILQPPFLLPTITTRLEAVKEIVETPDLLNSLQVTLPKFSDIDKLLLICMHVPQQDSLKAAELQLNYALMLKTILELLPALSDILENCTSGFLCSVREVIKEPSYSKILKRLLDTLHEDAHAVKGFTACQMQRSFAVKPQVNILLDVARKTYCEVIDDITRLVKDLAEEHNLPLRVNLNSTRGFHIQMPVGKKQKFNQTDLPPVFIQVQRNRSTFCFTTELLIQADERCKEAFHEIQMLSNVVILDLLNEIREEVGCLYKLCEKISELDMLTSFAKLSALPSYVCPQFGDRLDVKSSRHPILDFINPTEPVPNDIFATADKNFQIVTGPNMSGKTIYLRQIVLLQIMAQIGCYVPAANAMFRIADRIYARIGFDDSIECNASTFVLEVKEVQCILQTMTDSSLVVMDELCRGTSCEEGTAMAWALCEDFLRTKTFAFLTTHFMFLTNLEKSHTNVVNHHFETLEVNENGNIYLKYTHHLLQGITNVKHYGLHLAQTLCMPDSVIERGLEIAQHIAEQKIGPELEDCSSITAAACELADELLSLKESSELTPDKCKNLKKKYQFLQSQLPDHFLQQTPDKIHTSKRDDSGIGVLSTVDEVCAGVLSDIIMAITKENESEIIL
ncbi:mutS protein homolog 4-like [Schistocerca americana]|uniref:mutS protein homolog 4-like n=1 Tax=Schistocerca americana TaxID=7009 RepID=UPI001F4F7735|nr:mutS protein homolog 4-like [Schistocerca americana]